MMRIPTSALLLGLAGLIPFLWGGATAVSPYLETVSRNFFGQGLTGTELLALYGTVILSFMAGVIWGFYAHAQGTRMLLGLALSVLPALWIFFAGATSTSGTAPTRLLWALLIGFSALLQIDQIAARHGAAPAWWMSLRLLLTSVVAFCLSLGIAFAP